MRNQLLPESYMFASSVFVMSAWDLGSQWFWVPVRRKTVWKDWRPQQPSKLRASPRPVRPGCSDQMTKVGQTLFLKTCLFPVWGISSKLQLIATSSRPPKQKTKPNKETTSPPSTHTNAPKPSRTQQKTQTLGEFSNPHSSLLHFVSWKGIEFLK